MSSEPAQAPCTLRPMTVADLPEAHALCAPLQWPHRLEEWATMLRLSRGFVAAANGRVVGTAFACPQGSYASIGLVIVSGDYQGRGLGRRLMASALAAAEPAIAVLTATPAGAPLYEKLGFLGYGAIHQHQGIPGPVAPVAPVGQLAVGERLRPWTHDDDCELTALASAACGMDRSGPSREAFAAALQGVVIERDGRPCAFALLREFGRGLSIGPVIAEHVEQSKRLVSTLLASVPHAFVRLDVTASSGLSEWLAGLGLVQVDSGLQMVRGAPPVPTAQARQFALVTQAIG